MAWERRSRPPADVGVWIGRAERGDPIAFASLYDHVKPVVAAYVGAHAHRGTVRWTQREELVEQVVQEVLIALPGARVEGGEDLLRRLKRVAFERIRDARRRTRRLEGESAAGAGHGQPQAGASTGPVTRADDIRLIRELVAALPEKYARVIDLYVTEELEFEEIGRCLGITADAAYRRYARARETIKERLARRRDD